MNTQKPRLIIGKRKKSQQRDIMSTTFLVQQVNQGPTMSDEIKEYPNHRLLVKGEAVQDGDEIWSSGWRKPFSWEIGMVIEGDNWNPMRRRIQPSVSAETVRELVETLKHAKQDCILDRLERVKQAVTRAEASLKLLDL